MLDRHSLQVLLSGNATVVLMDTSVAPICQHYSFPDYFTKVTIIII